MIRPAVRRAASWALALAALLLLGACGSEVAAQAGDAAPTVATPSAPPDPSAGLPAGWRWESYRGVEVGVPDNWTYGSTGARLTQWCAGNAKPTRGEVARPGSQTDALCLSKKSGPGARIAESGTFVAFASHWTGADAPKDEADRDVIERAGVTVIVQGRPSLRKRILATVREAEVDANGCPSTDPISAELGARPPAGTPVGDLTAVTGLSACKYELPDGFAGTVPSGPTLMSSVSLRGAKAQEVVAAIAAAPAGGGPNDADSCLPKVSYGKEAIVLRVTSAQGLSRIYMRYSSCDHNGFDDGVAVRALSEEAAHPLVRGANFVSGYSGAGKLAILHPGADTSGAREKCACDVP
jgi:hypothetical protein